jgi:hypothetical protein
MAKYKRPRRPAPLKAVLKELKTVLARNKFDPAHRAEEDLFSKTFRAGYEYGIKRAIEIVNCEIGIRQDPPNFFYGIEEDPPDSGNTED